MPTLTGTVVIAQEGRMQVIDEAGAGHMLILSHSSAAEPRQLQALQAGQARVRISYSQPAGVLALLAHTIDMLDPAPKASRA